MPRIGYLVGSLSVNSVNRKAGRALANLAPSGVELVEIPIGGLPLFDRDLEADYPKAALELKEAISTVDALLFITPEHNRSVPAALKNAIDFASRPWGTSVLGGKPAGILGVSPGALGTAVAQAHLRSILPVLGVVVMGAPELYLSVGADGFSADGHPEPELEARLKNYLTAFVAFCERVSGVSDAVS